MNVAKIKDQLQALSQRTWPSEWTAKDMDEDGDYYGWCHRYKLEEPLAKEEVAEFERIYGTELPTEYRRFLLEVGNGGAGPHYGLYPLAEFDDQPISSSILHNLKRNFAHLGKWNDENLRDKPVTNEYDPVSGYYSEELMRGALPIATQGCALDYWLVVSGPSKGEIWLDRRSDGEGVEPVLDGSGQRMTFGSWYQSWLDSAFEQFKKNL